jgi:hypothetical protein
MIKELQVAIKGDAKKNILLYKLDMLQDQKKSFSLVTGLRGKDFKKRH